MNQNPQAPLPAIAPGAVSEGQDSRFSKRLRHGAANGPLMAIKRVCFDVQDIRKTPFLALTANLTEISPLNHYV